MEIPQDPQIGYPADKDGHRFNLFGHYSDENTRKRGEITHLSDKKIGITYEDGVYCEAEGEEAVKLAKNLRRLTSSELEKTAQSPA